jgi:hypothetical protein
MIGNGGYAVRASSLTRNASASIAPAADAMPLDLARGLVTGGLISGLLWLAGLALIL